MASRLARYLITGSSGQIGVSFSKALKQKFGKDSLIITDLKPFDSSTTRDFNFLHLNVLDSQKLKDIVKKYEITSIVHLAALLSATGEKNLKNAFELNVHCLSEIFLLAKEMNLQIFIPSTIAAFGADTPSPTSTVSIQRPTTLYGVSKVYMERLGEYFNKCHGVDFRSLRYPGIMSATPPGGGTTDYSVDVFYQGLKTGKYECYLKPKTKLPFAYIDDCINNSVKFLTSPNECLKERVYNYSAFDLTPEELFIKIKKSHMPELEVEYKIDPNRQQYADSWPKSLEVFDGEKDWGMKNEYDLARTVKTIFEELKAQKSMKK